MRDTERTPQVERYCAAIKEAIEALQTSSIELGERLDSVLPPEPPSVEGDTLKDEEALVPLASLLRDYNAQIRSVNDRLCGWLERLEL